MSKIERVKKPAFIVIDEIGYDESDDFHEEKDSNYEFLYQSNKMKIKEKDSDKVAVIDIKEPNRKRNFSDKDRTKNSRSTGLEVRKKRFNNTFRSEVIIDDDNDEEDIVVEHTVKPSMRKRKTSDEIVVTKKVRTTQASSSNLTSKDTKLKEHVNKDSDDVVEFESSSKTERKYNDEIFIIDPDRLNRKVKITDEDSIASTSTAITEIKKKGLERRTNIREKNSPYSDVASSSKNEIIIDDEVDEDIKVETNVKAIERRKRKWSNIVPAKTIKIDEPSSSKQNLDVDDAAELSEDASEESIDVVEYQSKQKTRRKYGDERTVIDLDEPDKQRNSRVKDGRSRKTKEAKKKMKSKIEMREEEEESDTDIASLLEAEVTVITDDEDTEEVQLEPNIPVKSTMTEESSKKASTTKAKTAKASISKAKTAKASTSKKELENKLEGERSSTREPKNKIQTENCAFNGNPNVEWSECDYLCEFNQIESQVAENLISLFKNENTIPFIARYRKELTGGMEPEQLRSIRNSYDNLKLVKGKALTILQKIDKLGKWNPEIYSAIMAAKSIPELELIYAPFKPGTKRSLAERARELGLTSICEDILLGQPVNLSSFIDCEREGLRNVAEVRQGIIHIIADVISKDKTTFEGILRLRKRAVMRMQTKKSKTASSSTKPAKIAISAKSALKDKPSESDLLKFENYYSFSCSEKSIRDYQILAINRGEEHKILSVTITFPEWFESALKSHCLEKYRFVRNISQFHWDIIEQSFDDAYTRLIKPQVIRQVRHELNAKAESASIEVFASNLKNLLLTPPLRGKTVLGIDPGFTNGCKMAVVSHSGNVLDTATIYPHRCDNTKKRDAAECLIYLVKKHNCTVIALGNATACRETETFLNDLIQKREFAPIDLCYTIIDECGASIYSCSKEAKAEYPDLDPTIISAVSLARRLQDPLAELIKVEPKHLGIGMYQHDLPQKQLQLTLNEVISETVSFVGVDVNTASQSLLTKVAGLSDSRAANIIKHRNNCGPFTNRQQLLEVCGIGKKFFEQCAGFVRILPETASIRGALFPAKKYSLDYLDQTWIHPESYDVARQFLKACGCSPDELGSDNFIKRVMSYERNRGSKILAKEFGTSATTMDIIIKGLSMKKGEDIRIDRDAPLFQKNLRCIDDLCVNTRLTGSVRNVTNFGTFVDIGVGTAGLIPRSKMRGQELSLGQRVEVSVLYIDKTRGRIGLAI